jgi:hypothetical protein
MVPIKQGVIMSTMIQVLVKEHDGGYTPNYITDEGLTTDQDMASVFDNTADALDFIAENNDVEPLSEIPFDFVSIVEG